MHQKNCLAILKIIDDVISQFRTYSKNIFYRKKIRIYTIREIWILFLRKIVFYCTATLRVKQMMINQKNTYYFRFEDGTLSFLSILSLRHGFDTLRRLNLDMDLISKHTFSLAQFVYRNLATLHHSNGKPVVVFYHDSAFNDITLQGGTVNFNLLRDDGEYVGNAEVSTYQLIFVFY